MSECLCPNCSAPNPPAAHFCARCGTQLPARPVCPYCGYPDNPSSAAHCAGCGRQLTTTRLPGRRLPLAVWIAAGVAGILLVFSATCVLGALAPVGLTSPFLRSKELDRSGGPMTEIGSRATQQIRNSGTPSNKPPAAAAETSTTPAEATPTATASPSATPWPTATPLPTDTPTPIPTPCGIAVQGAFTAAWNAFGDQLACPIGAGRQNVWMAEERFQNGRMFWREDNDKIYVLYTSGRWARYENIWRESDPTYTCGTQSSPPTPLRGFGKVWCTHEPVRQALGNATTAEAGQHGTTQDFLGGTILRTGSGATFVLLGSGTWQNY